jgi:hypothetical protein
MRDLKYSDKNKVTLTDGPTGEKMDVFYSTPTAAQMKAYRQASLRRKGNKVLFDSFDPSVKYGLEIITGFSEGAFGFDGKPISAAPESPNYREDWKSLLAETAVDVITIVASVAFDGVRVDQGDAGVEFAGEGAEDVVPLGKN